MVYTIYVKEYSSDQIYTFLGDTIDHSFDECKIIFSKHYECKGGHDGTDGTGTSGRFCPCGNQPVS
jgi:hypothetical protein